MKILSTLAFLALVIQCTLATSERKLLRAGYDNPINFSDLASLTDVNTEKLGTGASVPGVNSLSKGSILPSTDSLPTSGLGKDIVLTDLTTVAGGRSGLQSLTDRSGLGSISNGVAKGGKLPSLPTSGTGSVTKGVSGITNNVLGLSDGLALPSTSTSGGKQTYKSGE
ncbi:hypothetical protein V7S43_015711 [Phytophthora oleae]|uniref:RxLR effector protein n=1 Tax=Phytophthora oleae TaxID=2107226 RepID=A0ABD3EY58_9STRA